MIVDILNYTKTLNIVVGSWPMTAPDTNCKVALLLKKSEYIMI